MHGLPILSAGRCVLRQCCDLDLILRGSMAKARVFRSGNSQAVRLPKEFQIDADEVEIFRRGEEIVLRKKAENLGRAFELLASLPSDGFSGERQDPPPQKRKRP
jgi:antitoxin VapB